MQKKDLKTGMLVKAKNNQSGICNIYKVFKEGQFHNQLLLVREGIKYLQLSEFLEDLSKMNTSDEYFTLLEIRDPSYPAPSPEVFRKATREDLQEEFSKAKVLWPIKPKLDLAKSIAEVFKTFKEIIDNKP